MEQRLFFEWPDVLFLIAAIGIGILLGWLITFAVYAYREKQERAAEALDRRRNKRRNRIVVTEWYETPNPKIRVWYRMEPDGSVTETHEYMEVRFR